MMPVAVTQVDLALPIAIVCLTWAGYHTLKRRMIQTHEIKMTRLEQDHEIASQYDDE